MVGFSISSSSKRRKFGSPFPCRNPDVPKQNIENPGMMALAQQGSDLDLFGPGTFENGESICILKFKIIFH